MTRIIIPLFVLTYLMLFGCSNNKKPTELIETFNKNKPSLDLLINKLQKDKKLDSLFQIEVDSGLPNIKSTYPDMYAIFNEVGITDASSHRNPFPKWSNWYYLKTNWLNEHSIYLIFNAYDSSETTKGFYLKDQVLNETWGLGENWKMFRFVKFRPYKQ